MKEMPRDEVEVRARSLARRELPAAWRSQILEAAREEEESPALAWWLPPRWLGFGLAACWAFIVVLNVLAPPSFGTNRNEEAKKALKKGFEERRILVSTLGEEGGRP